MAAERKVAVVTGSNKGIGLAIVRALCKQFQGDVYLTSRDEGRGREAVALLEGEGLALKYHQLDITSLDSVDALRKFVLETYGGIDVLVNNAGIAFRHSSTATPLEQASKSVETNFTGLLNMMRAFSPITKEHGRIVLVSAYHPELLSRLSSQDLRDRFSNPKATESDIVSLMEEFVEDVRAGRHGEKGWCKTFYASCKVGETALMKVYARELEQSGKEDILVNCCNPGSVQTDMSSHKGTLLPDQGAETPTMLALLPPGSPTGAFWKEKTLSSW